MKKRIWTRLLIASVAVAVVAVVVVLALRPVPIRVETRTVETGPLRVTVDAEGKTRVHDRFLVTAPVAGKLARIDLHRGDTVKQNDPIARIDPLPLAPLDPRQVAEARARVAAAEQAKTEADAVVAQTRTACDQAQRDYARAAQLVETGDVSKEAFERARSTVQTCRKQIDAAVARSQAAAADVDAARSALLALEMPGQSGTATPVVVRSPVTSNILDIPEVSERVVAAGTPILSLRGQSLEIVIEVLSSDAVNVRPGAPVLIEGWGGDRALRGRVRLIEPAAFTKVSALGVEEQRVNVIADFVDPPGALGDGYRIEARIVTWESDRVLKAPASAFFRRGEDWAVFVVENGKARLRKVVIGHRSPTDVEVLNGLTAGETVVPHPSNELSDGAPVEAVKSP